MSSKSTRLQIDHLNAVGNFVTLDLCPLISVKQRDIPFLVRGIRKKKTNISFLAVESQKSARSYIRLCALALYINLLCLFEIKA